MTAPRELRTERLLLHPFTEQDIPDLVRLAGMREIAATTLHIPHPYTQTDASSFIANTEQQYRLGLAAVFAVAALASGDLRGAVGLSIHPGHHRAELGYWIGVPYWGQGLATEAVRAVVAFGFGELGLHRIFASHFSGNTASRRVLEKVGMRPEGRWREHVRKFGQFTDVENFGLLASDI